MIYRTTFMSSISYDFSHVSNMSGMLSVITSGRIDDVMIMVRCVSKLGVS